MLIPSEKFPVTTCEDRFNDFFTIRYSVRVNPSLEIVLGESNIREKTPFVTWMCQDDTNYFQGYYYRNITDAEISLFMRYSDSLKEKD